MAKNYKMVICRKCNASIAKNEKRCPSCGAKNKKPLYKRGWFIFMLLIVVAFVMLISKNGKKGEEFSWSDFELGKYIPVAESNIGRIAYNTDEQLIIDVYETTYEDYKEYIKACEDKGYVVESEKSDSRYTAYNSEGYKLELWYSDGSEEMDINLYAPEEMKVISLPTNGIGAMLPVPKSNVGKVIKDSSNSYIVKVANTTMNDFSDYVKECEKAGFTVDYRKYDDSYHANNSEGYKLLVKYTGFNTMEVSIEIPEEDKQTETTKKDENDKTDEPETTKKENNDKSELVDGMRPEFKEAMDSYEKFYKEYCEVLKKYNNNPTDLSLLNQYTKLMQQSVEMGEKFEAWDNGEMNDVELKYYLEVSGRVTQMLIEVNK